MKTSNSIYLSLILSISLVSNVEAAKENFDRSKPAVNTTNGLDNDCNSKLNKDVCKPSCKPSNSARCPKPFGHVTVLKAKEGHVTVLKAKEGHVTVLKARALSDSQNNQSSGTRGQDDYNSSRSNKQGISHGGGDDLVLRKRPGRTKYTPTINCVKAKKGDNSQTKPSCPENNR